MAVVTEQDTRRPLNADLNALLDKAARLDRGGKLSFTKDQIAERVRHELRLEGLLPEDNEPANLSALQFPAKQK